MTISNNKFLFLSLAGAAFGLIIWLPLWFLLDLYDFPILWGLLIYVVVGGSTVAGTLLIVYLMQRFEIKGAPRKH